MPSTEGNTNNASCNFRTLGSYNQIHNPAMVGTPSIPTTTALNMQIVPAYQSISYDTLQHGVSQPQCGNHFTITQAYGTNANNCQTQYIKRLCA